MKGEGKKLIITLNELYHTPKKTSLQIKNVSETKEKREEKNVWKHLERS
jgi:hypothetical protein